MQCPACGANSDITIGCSECAQGITDDPAYYEFQEEFIGLAMNPAVEAANHENVKRSSTLIEFPGVVRPTLPEWRKELSERVREVQERRAREAAREAEAQAQLQVESGATHQLELLPQVEVPAMNPLVAAALKRIERAHQPPREEVSMQASLAATAYAPALEQDNIPDSIVISPTELSLETLAETTEIDEEAASTVDSRVEKTHGLVVVAPPVAPPVPTVVQTPAPPKRLIVDDPNDPALNYLDSISRNLCVDELDQRRASRFRRIVSALIDLILCGILTLPIPGAIKFTGNTLYDRRAIIVIVVSFVIMSFIYQTMTIALTGRTWAMRLLSLRIIDRKTGLIPTGGQALGRAFLYLISLAAAGLGILFALVSREGRTVQDEFTRTEVIKT
jgi:hypothetical protein